jgi:hypothetical protein
MPGKPVEVEAYTGWLLDFFNGVSETKFLAEDLKSKKYSSGTLAFTCFISC